MRELLIIFVFTWNSKTSKQSIYYPYYKQLSEYIRITLYKGNDRGTVDRIVSVTEVEVVVFPRKLQLSPLIASSCAPFFNFDCIVSCKILRARVSRGWKTKIKRSDYHAKAGNCCSDLISTGLALFIKVSEKNLRT